MTVSSASPIVSCAGICGSDLTEHEIKLLSELLADIWLFVFCRSLQRMRAFKEEDARL
jgi:hypothetical protein